MEARLARAMEELKHQHLYDHVVVNDNLEDALEKIHAILRNHP